MTTDLTFQLDGEDIAFTPGQTIMQAAKAAGVYIPHLCWHPDFPAHGSCKLCTVKANGRFGSGCTMEAQAGMVVENRTAELDDKRRTLLQMFFVEGNHFCPSCEKSGNCTLQATAYELKMMSPHFDMFYPDRPVDASHPDVLLDFNRCIMCSLCVTASRDVDKKMSSPWADAASSAAASTSTANRASSATPTSPSPTAPPASARSA